MILSIYPKYSKIKVVLYGTQYELYYAISLHSPERMTVNHDVTGSSPVGGAIKG